MTNHASIILLANRAFAQIVGHEQNGLAGSVFPEIVQAAPADLPALAGVDAATNLVIRQWQP
jgi:hypothetical protein